jgi:hypothetical protein
MVKKQPDMSDIFAKTEPDTEPIAEPEKEDPVQPVGIGLRTSEWERMSEIAAELGMKRHALAMWALRDFMKRYDAGEIETATKKTLPGL